MSSGGPFASLPCLSSLAWALAVAWCFPAASVWANPSGGVAVVGKAQISSSGTAMLVTTQNGAGLNHSAINWQSFSIPAGSSTYFQQPNSSSTVINRVITANPSLIFGSLGSNGRVVLVNQAGITVGAGAFVDTAAFTASALQMGDADALSGRMRFGDAAVIGGAVDVQGQVLARAGDVVLLGQRVTTGAAAAVQAPNGSTVLAAGQQAEITGRGLEGIRLLVQAPSDEVLNLGQLSGDAVGIFAGTLRHSGVARAQAVTESGGRVYLKASGMLDISGTVAAGQGAKGGSILASGAQTRLAGSAVLDASGAQGGGEVLVGGGYQGGDARLSNAQSTQVDAGARLAADALTSGNGGTVVVWSDGSTRYAGALSARGGSAGGNGGRAEVSGKSTLEFMGTADLWAAQGLRGSLLLDPVNLDISSTGTLLSSLSAYSDPNYSGTSSISTASIVTLLASTDVTLAASQDINLSSDISLNVAGAAGSLTLNAGRNIAGSSASISMPDNNVVLKAATGSISLGGITARSLTLSSATTSSLSGTNVVGFLNATVGGTSGFSFNNHNNETSGNFTITGLKVAGGSTSIDNYGAIFIKGPIDAGTGRLGITAQSPITVAGNLSATGDIQLTATAASTDSNITLNAGYSIRSSGGRVQMTAYNNIDQFGYVYGANGVTADAQNGRFSFGMTGYSGGSPISYTQAGTSVTAPLAPLVVTLGSALGDPVSSPLDVLLAAADSDLAGSDPFDPANQDKDALLVEGQVCVP